MIEGNSAHRKLTVILFLMVLLVLSAVPVGAATKSATIDFNNLTAGTIVNTLSVGNGISGDPIGGFIAVFGVNPEHGGNNAAMIFDATCGGDPSSCSGEDDDLFQTALGRVLIISEDLNSGDPDDADRNDTYFTFDYSGFGPGSVHVGNITFQDVEASQRESATVILFANGIAFKTVNIPKTLDGEMVTVDMDADGVDYMEVHLKGSGAIDNIELTVDEDEPGGGQGCTPGYWKQEQHFDSWAATGYTTGQLYSDVFGTGPAISLLGALKANGGGENALWRHSVAALLNAANGDVSYVYTVDQVISMVNAAYASQDFEPTKNLFEAQNEAGCPLN